MNGVSSIMNRIPLLLAATLTLAVSSCDKAKELLAKTREVKAAKSASGSSPGQADVRDLTPSQFAEIIKTPGKLVVIDYHAEWCGPCKMLGPVLSEVAGEYAGRAVVGRIDVDKAAGLVRGENVGSIPDVRFYRDGKQVDQFVGFQDAGQVRKKFAQHAPTATAAAAAEATPGSAGEATPAPAPVIQPMKKDWRPPGIEKR